MLTAVSALSRVSHFNGKRANLQQSALRLDRSVGWYRPKVLLDGKSIAPVLRAPLTRNASGGPRRLAYQGYRTVHNSAAS
eukprot:scaffold1803_cov63-Phaeocystis_antarctica.AAC.1